MVKFGTIISVFRDGDQILVLQNLVSVPKYRNYRPEFHYPTLEHKTHAELHRAFRTLSIEHLAQHTSAAGNVQAVC